MSAILPTSFPPQTGREAVLPREEAAGSILYRTAVQRPKISNPAQPQQSSSDRNPPHIQRNGDDLAVREPAFEGNFTERIVPL